MTKLEEEIEMSLDDLSYSQAYNLFRLGEIDSITLYECMQDLKEKTLLFKIKNQIKKLKEYILRKYGEF